MPSWVHRTTHAQVRIPPGAPHDARAGSNPARGTARRTRRFESRQGHRTTHAQVRSRRGHRTTHAQVRIPPGAPHDARAGSNPARGTARRTRRFESRQGHRTTHAQVRIPPGAPHDARAGSNPAGGTARRTRRFESRRGHRTTHAQVRIPPGAPHDARAGSNPAGAAADSDLPTRSETGRRHRLMTQSPPKQGQHRIRHANRGVLRDHAACQPTRAIEPDPHTPRQPTTNSRRSFRSIRNAPTPGRWIPAKSRSEIPAEERRSGRPRRPGGEHGKHWESTQHAQGEHTVAAEGTASPQRKDADHLCPWGGHPTERELRSGRALRKHAEGMPEIRRPRFEHRRGDVASATAPWTAKHQSCASSLARRPLQR